MPYFVPLSWPWPVLPPVQLPASRASSVKPPSWPTRSSNDRRKSSCVAMGPSPGRQFHREALQFEAIARLADHQRRLRPKDRQGADKDVEHRRHRDDAAPLHAELDVEALTIACRHVIADDLAGDDLRRLL